MFSVRYTGRPLVQEMPFDPQSLEPELLASVDTLWTEAQEEHPNTLFNGQLFNVVDTDGPLIRGHFIEYKVFVAAWRQPKLFSDFPVRPLGVTGVSRCADGIILGKRSDHVTQDPGLWELVPSGGIEMSSRGRNGTIDFERQFVQEFTEETGQLPELISQVRPLFVVEDASTRAFDIIADLILDASRQQVEVALADASNDEYQEFEVLSAQDIETFLEAHIEHAAPLTRHLICDLKLAAKTPA